MFEYSPIYRTKQCTSKPVCPLLRGQPYGPCKEYTPVYFEGIPYPPATIPCIQEDLIGEFLKFYFSPEGTITDRVQLSQRHPTLLYQVQDLLCHLGIESSVKGYATKDNRYEWFLRIYSKNIIKFYDYVGILPVRIQQKTITKEQALETLVRKIKDRLFLDSLF